jgi:hypothetical protein
VPDARSALLCRNLTPDRATLRGNAPSRPLAAGPIDPVHCFIRPTRATGRINLSCVDPGALLWIYARLHLHSPTVICAHLHRSVPRAEIDATEFVREPARLDASQLPPALPRLRPVQTPTQASLATPNAGPACLQPRSKPSSARFRSRPTPTRVFTKATPPRRCLP